MRATCIYAMPQVGVFSHCVTVTVSKMCEFQANFCRSKLSYRSYGKLKFVLDLKSFSKGF